MVRRKKYYLILEKKSRHLYGSFPRTKAGHDKAKNYSKELLAQNIKCVIK